MNYYKRYPGDYARDTKHLTMLEHGAYTLLLDAYYATGKPLSSSYKILTKVCAATTPQERSAVKRVLEEFFTLKADGYHNGKADKIIKRDQPRIDASRANGARGGRPKQPVDNSSTNNPGKTQRVVDNKPRKNPAGYLSTTQGVSYQSSSLYNIHTPLDITSDERSQNAEPNGVKSVSRGDKSPNTKPQPTVLLPYSWMSSEKGVWDAYRALGKIPSKGVTKQECVDRMNRYLEKLEHLGYRIKRTSGDVPSNQVPGLLEELDKRLP